jgi:hypothetical protein
MCGGTSGWSVVLLLADCGGKLTILAGASVVDAEVVEDLDKSLLAQAVF